MESAGWTRPLTVGWRVRAVVPLLLIHRSDDLTHPRSLTTPTWMLFTRTRRTLDLSSKRPNQASILSIVPLKRFFPLSNFPFAACIYRETVWEADPALFPSGTGDFFDVRTRLLWIRTHLQVLRDERMARYVFYLINSIS